MNQILFKDESYAIMGACFEVYRDKGCGFNEDVHQECLEIEFVSRGIPFPAPVHFPLGYKGKWLTARFKADFVCYEKIIVEIKSFGMLLDPHRAQVLNYLNATHFQLGLLVNFGAYPKVESERFALSENAFRELSRVLRADVSLTDAL